MRPWRQYQPLAAALLVVAALATPAVSAQPDAAVLAAQAERIATIDRISKPTLAIFGADGKGGGSGVIISPDGYALTNFHVTAPTGPAMKCGLADGRYVDAVLVGLDPGGDVALIKLIGEEPFPAAELGDSDTVRVGDWAYVVGNPFLLADDFTPTVTYGIISGVHRYQYPAGTLLEYADCLQTDAAINPGNSGGPLFDSAGRLIGINGRGSFEKRGRVNVGVGYAISINQIKRFLGLLKSGRIVDHASLGATVATDSEGRVYVDDILESSDAFRRGLRYGDEIVRFGSREIDSANAFKNALGTYPADWAVPIAFRRDGKQFEREVRLASLHRSGELEALLQADKGHPVPEKPQEGDERQPPEQIPAPPEPGESPPENPPEAPLAKSTPLPRAVRDYYEAAPGYANYWFNRYHQQRVWNAFLAKGDFATSNWNWKIHGRTPQGGDVIVTLTRENGTIVLPEGQSGEQFDSSLIDATAPPRSGGMLAALHLWQRLLIVGPGRFGEVYYLGTLPWGETDAADCLVAIHAGVETRFYFDPATADIAGIEFKSADDTDTCRIYLSDLAEFDGYRFPRHWKVQHGDETFVEFTVSTFQTSDTDSEPARTD